MNQKMRISHKFVTSSLRHISDKAKGVLHTVSGLDKLEIIYRGLATDKGTRVFLENALDKLNIHEQLSEEQLWHIPASGSTVIVANHPHGAVEGMILLKLALQRRLDIRVLANSWLQNITELQPFIIPVNPFPGSKAKKQNVTSIRRAIEWVHRGGLLIVFPAGEVSSWRWSELRIADPPWHIHAANIVKRTGADVVPVFFHGRNSLLFNLMGCIHPLLRTLLLPWELLGKYGASINLAIGKTIPASRMKTMGDQMLTDYLRARTYLLAHYSELKPYKDTVLAVSRQLPPVIPAVSPDDLKNEIGVLAEKNCQLISIGDLTAYCGGSDEIPCILREIGRLRELTFREAGEGSGRSLDLDAYDSYYLHLFIWDEANCRVVGAYRLGAVDEIIRRYGIKGLYSYSLFKYNKQFIEGIEPALELGRSFIRKEYQRSFAPLLLLWKGIGRFLVQHPQYSTLFGPVSVSNNYQPTSQQLLIKFLKLHNFEPKLGRTVKPRNPVKLHGKWTTREVQSMQHLDQVSEIISLLENKDIGVPVLIKHYLKLGGVMLGFNVDRHFSNAVDCLIKVDLTRADPNVLEKYFTREGVETILAYHGYQQAS